MLGFSCQKECNEILNSELKVTISTDDSSSIMVGSVVPLTVVVSNETEVEGKCSVEILQECYCLKLNAFLLVDGDWEPLKIANEKSATLELPFLEVNDVKTYDVNISLNQSGTYKLSYELACCDTGHPRRPKITLSSSERLFSVE